MDTIHLNRCDQIKRALKQENDTFIAEERSKTYYLRSADIRCYDRHSEILNTERQVYFYRAMTFDEAWQWVQTWKNDDMKFFRCWEDPLKSLSLASYFLYPYGNSYFHSGCVILEFYAPDFIHEIRERKIVKDAKPEDGDMSWSIGQNCTSGQGPCFHELKNELPKIFFQKLLGIRMVAYKL